MPLKKSLNLSWLILELESDMMDSLQMMLSNRWFGMLISYEVLILLRWLSVKIEIGTFML